MLNKEMFIVPAPGGAYRASRARVRAARSGGILTLGESRRDHDKPLASDKFMRPLFLFDDLSKIFCVLVIIYAKPHTGRAVFS